MPTERDHSNWTGKPILVTGGASFIGSHLVDALVERGATLRVVDDLSSGRIEHVRPHLTSGSVELIEGDLLDPSIARRSVDGIDTVFHLAADHGGRGYVDLHQVACSTNMALDAQLFRASDEAGVRKLVYASSGCVYPNLRSMDPEEELYLTEDMAGPPYDADGLYGWAKLMGELTLQRYVQEQRMGAVSLRYFTVYGERGKEDHAVMAMIARAFIRQDPFEVWGSGMQIRNWTHVDDIVSGTLAAAERIDDGSAINLGTMERTRVIDAVKDVLTITGHDAEIRLRPEMPTGPMNRVADNALARRRLNWAPQVPFAEGLRRTIRWYYETQDAGEVTRRLASALLERAPQLEDQRPPA